MAPAPRLPTELVLLMEGFRGPRDAAEGVGGFLPHSGGAAGLGGVEEGGGAAGPPAHWEGTETGERAAGKGWDEARGRDGDAGSRLGCSSLSGPSLVPSGSEAPSPEVTAVPDSGTGALFLPRTESRELLLPAPGRPGVQRTGGFYQGKGPWEGRPGGAGGLEEVSVQSGG